MSVVHRVISSIKICPKIFETSIFLRYFSKPISSFLGENILTSSLFSNGGFARSSITGDLGRNSLKRGTEKLFVQ